MSDELTSRVAVLESRHDDLRDDVKSISTKLDKIHDLLMQAKGAKWTVMSLAGVVGTIAGLCAKWLPFPGK